MKLQCMLKTSEGKQEFFLLNAKLICDLKAAIRDAALPKPTKGSVNFSLFSFMKYYFHFQEMRNPIHGLLTSGI